ncbi:MAG: hypothetical protein AAGF20_01765 [Pseudomonadota bacterium]
MIRTILASACALGFAGAAMAGTAFTAQLEEPVAKFEKVAAAKALWSCSDDTCKAELDRRTVKVSTCKKVAKEVGKLVSFGNAKDQLSAEDLEECNKSAK